MWSSFDILLVSGLHPNETCAPILAREVHRQLCERGERVALYEVPYAHTLLALLDEPEAAVTDYSMPAGCRCLDVDLDALDGILSGRYPGALVFEFHNCEDTHPVLGIDPAKPVEQYELGPIGPGADRAYELGYWRNIDAEGRPAKFVVESPAHYVPVAPDVRLARERRLAQLGRAGYAYDLRWRHYFERQAHVEMSRAKGYLDPCLVHKIAEWIASVRAGGA